MHFGQRRLAIFDAGSRWMTQPSTDYPASCQPRSRCSYHRWLREEVEIISNGWFRLRYSHYQPQMLPKKEVTWKSP